MKFGRLLRLLAGFLLLPVVGHSATRIDIHIGEIRHPNFNLENFAGTITPDGEWHGVASLKQGDLNQLAPELPVKFSKGTVHGKLAFEGKAEVVRQLKVDLNLDQTAFSNESGTRAAEKLSGSLSLQAKQAQGLWSWQARINWREGELFWQPLYFAKGGHSLQAQGL